MRHSSQCLCYLAGAEYRSSSWDDAVTHAELAVSLARDADRVQDLAFVHSVAAVVPALRGNWEVASRHVRLATEAGQASGDPEAIIAGAIAQAFLAMAHGDLEGVADAAAAARATGKAEVVSLQGRYDWRSLEINALIGLARLGQAEAALAELEAALSPASPAAPALPGLTPAEQAVARLVAAGHSNRQAAGKLYVSVKTVEFHLGHIFDKLGIRSRQDLITRIGSPQPRPGGAGG